MDARWKFKFVDCGCPDARFILGLSRSFSQFNDQRGTEPAKPDEKDAETWKEYFATFKQRPLIAFALAVDFNQEPAQRAMEANRWKLVATGERGHDRVVSGTNVYARLYMKKFPRTGHVFPVVQNITLQSGYTCSFQVEDYSVGTWTAPVTHCHYATGTMILHRIPADKPVGFAIPKTNFAHIAHTPYADYYLSNAVKLFVEEI
jgi:hypothetical protein